MPDKTKGPPVDGSKFIDGVWKEQKVSYNQRDLVRRAGTGARPCKVASRRAHWQRARAGERIAAARPSHSPIADARARS